MIIIGTDLPVSHRQLSRILRRAAVGLVRTGSFVGHGSGDVVLGFTTANRLCREQDDLRQVTLLREEPPPNRWRKPYSIRSAPPTASPRPAWAPPGTKP